MYFAYGSNLDEPQMLLRCPGAQVISPGCLNNYRLDFTWFSPGWSCGVADIVETKGREVWGLVYEVTQQDLDALDWYEAVPDAYIRFQTTIDTINGRQKDVWVYSACDKGSFTPPSSRYLRIMKYAAEKYKFPPHYKDALNAIPVKAK
jgi:gamma-glutamylcyclotransferase (GGCT)/AIG2-like uncharacterized protein YtfP